MPNTKISDLSANATQVNSTDVFPSVQTAGVGPVKTTAAQIKTFVNDGATHTGVTAFPAGSAAAPSIIPTGDTNTGFWFPAADTIAASTGGTERMRITSGGNVGINTGSPSAYLHVNGVGNAALLSATAAADGTAYPLDVFANVSASAVVRMRFGTAANVFTNHSYLEAQTITGTTSDLRLGTSGVERMRITSAGNVGIGTSAPGFILDVQQSIGGNAYVQVKNAGAGRAGIVINSGGGSDANVNFQNQGTATATISSFSFAQNAPLVFYGSNGSTLYEMARFTNNGSIGIATQSPTALLDVNSDTIRLRTAKTPASATATGNAGDICWDSGYVYVCVAANTWKRAAIATW